MVVGLHELHDDQILIKDPEFLKDNLERSALVSVVLNIDYMANLISDFSKEDFVEDVLHVF